MTCSFIVTEIPNPAPMMHFSSLLLTHVRDGSLEGRKASLSLSSVGVKDSVAVGLQHSSSVEDGRMNGEDEGNTHQDTATRRELTASKNPCSATEGEEDDGPQPSRPKQWDLLPAVRAM